MKVEEEVLLFFVENELGRAQATAAVTGVRSRDLLNFVVRGQKSLPS